jgi:hypothetical protein
MNIDRIVIAVAGFFILASVSLAYVHDCHWLWFTAFVGANLLQSVFTRFCPLAKILKALGARPGMVFS